MVRLVIDMFLLLGGLNRLLDVIVDIVFMVDFLVLVGNLNFKKEKEFVKLLVWLVNVIFEKLRIVVIVYSRLIIFVVWFDGY